MARVGKTLQIQVCTLKKQIKKIVNIFTSRSCNYLAKMTLRNLDLINLKAKKENFVLHLKQT